jgi:hypothetical protein
MPADRITAAAEASGLRSVLAPSVEDGVDVALKAAGLDGLVLVTGSLWVVGPGRARLLEHVGLLTS